MYDIWDLVNFFFVCVWCVWGKGEGGGEGRWSLNEKRIAGRGK